ncbi:MAG: hypothetical protein KIT09_26865 [Bryobacteraceae bacterium]|nr:hypothetical protein [Bryobacteraceae bacterium]
MRGWLLAAVALAGCVPQRPDHVPIDPALVMLVPPDANTLAGVRLDRLRGLPYYDRILSIGPDGGIERYFRDAGLDPRSDLWELLLASNGKDTAVMLRGKFSAMGLEPQLRREGAIRMPYKGYMMLGDERIAVLFMNSSTAAVGPPPLLRSIVDRRGEAAGLPPALAQQVETIPYGNQIWAVSIAGFFPGLQDSSSNWGNAGRLLERTRSFTFAATLNGGLRFEMAGECASSRDANSLEGVARGMVGIGRFAARKTPSLQRMYGAITVSRDERTVRAQAAIAGPELEALLTELIPAAH